ncbi:hypothetical protein DYB37_004361, partial [Aphanomyces astaci]
IATCVALMHTRSFGGASVTIPHKLDIIPHLSSLSAAAATIGAVNTILSIRSNKVALVVGAGGTAMAACYAMQQLGLRLVVFNRTLDKAIDVAQRFGGTAVASLTDLDAVDVVVGTIPAAAGFVLPEHLLSKHVIVMDAAYKPAITPLLAQAHAHGAVCIQGYEMLVEQGLEQSKLWTHEAVAKEVLASQVKATLAASDVLH